jgi:CheY-like chemotaxis protein
LNLPRRDGRAVLAEVKADPELNELPVVIFTTSRSSHDIARCYELGANCYVSKPGNLGQFFSAVRSLETFWFGFASLPD